MNTFTIAEAFSHGWDRTKEQFWLVAGVISTHAVISVALARISELAKVDDFLNILMFVISLALGTALRIGSAGFFLNANEGKGAFKDLFNTRGVFFTYFVAYVILTVMIISGLILLIVPGIMLYIIFMFVPTLIVDKGMGVKEAFIESASITEGYRLKLLGFAGVCILVNFVGVLAFFVGLLVTVPMTLFAGVYVYRRLMSDEVSVIAENTSESAPSEPVL